MVLRLSKHAVSKHSDERWNAVSIKEAFLDGEIEGCTLLEGNTADIICGYIEGECVGIVVSKECNGERVIITGFAAPMEYWESV